MRMPRAILLIEDNPGDARLVREHLAARIGKGWRFDVVETLAQGLAWLKVNTADVVLLDLGLPDSQGLGTFLRVRHQAPATPVIILSGDDEDLALEAVNAGAEDYLAKDHVDARTLARCLRNAVGRPDARIARRTWQQLMRSEAQRQALLETAEEGILELDGQGRVSSATERARVLLSATWEQLRGTEFVRLIAAGDAAAAARLFGPQDGGERRNAVLCLRCFDGNERWMNVVARRVEGLGGDGTGAHVMVMLTDVDARVRAEQALQELRADHSRLERFSSTLAHDLRTPLNAISGFASLLASDQDNALSADGQRQLQLIQRGAQDMADLVDGLLRLARLEHSTPVRGYIDLGKMAHSVIAQLKAGDPQRRVTVVVEDTPPAYADATLMRTVMSNLLGNAWKYTARAGDPEIRFRPVPSAVGMTAYAVEDNGVGFSPESAGRLFEPFVRLPTSRGFAGHGLGLASVKRVVELHGGAVWAESQPGVRTSFGFTLSRPTTAIY